MFDVGFWEIALIGVIALLILGPERLPRVARTAGHWVGRARRFVTQVKADINAEIEAEDLAKFRQMGDELKSVQSDIKQSGNSFKQTVESENRELLEAINESAPTVTASDGAAAADAGAGSAVETVTAEATAARPGVSTSKKKSAAKKTVRKKTAASKTAGKKTTAKKTAGKKTTAKKTAAKKTAKKKNPANAAAVEKATKRTAKTAVQPVRQD